MTVKELVERLSKHDPDAEVCVKVTNCMCSAVAEPVTDVIRGFDWIEGKVMLRTDSDLQRVYDMCRKCSRTGYIPATDDKKATKRGDPLKRRVPGVSPIELVRMLEKAHEATKGSQLIFE